ncbi:SIMPL domain-containing protein [Rhizobium sp.]|uniref:SIMPL domain-containing protein n=1 Tax=Rhizobium sp. TaxID=391 RepID=UPI002AA68AA9
MANCRLMWSVAVSLAAFVGSLPVAAQEVAHSEAVINISGEGDASLAPNMAILQLGVVSEDEAAAAALKANNVSMAKVLKMLTDQSVVERDIQTSGFDIVPRYRPVVEGMTDDKPPVIDGYRVSNGLTVRVRDLSKLGAVIDGAVQLGVNQAGSIRFTNDKPELAINDARKDAMQDAIAKAKVLTEAAGIKLGRIVSINENAPRPFEQTMMMKTSMARDMPMAPTPIATGENNYHVAVNVTFALVQ